MSRHTPFDGGSVTPYRTAVRNAVVELLSPLLRANGAFLTAIVKLPDRLQRFDTEAKAQLFAQLLGRAPAMGVVTGDRISQPHGIGGYKQLSFLDVHLYFVHNSMRSLMARVEPDIVSAGDNVLEGDPTADPGVDIAMQCAEELLVGRQPERPAPNPPEAPSTQHGPGVIRYLELKREEGLASDNQLTIWEQTYTVGVSRSIDRTRGVLARVLAIQTNVHPPALPSSPARTEFEHTFEEAP
jgi:hypothetical protein